MHNMINLNLLPSAQRHLVFREILARFFTALLLFVVVWGGVTVAFLLVGQIFLRTYNQALTQQLRVEESTDTAEATQTFEQQAKKTNALLAYTSSIAAEPHDDDASLVALITSLVPAGIHLQSLVINSVSGNVTLGGMAETREEFLAFQKELEAQKDVFAGVESPLSNLLSPNNISFSFLITLKR